MAIAAATGLAAFDNAAGQFLDLSDVLAELIRSDNTAFLGRIPMRGMATETQHSWIEDALVSQTVTAASTIGSATTGSIMNAAMPNQIVIGAVLRDRASTGNAMGELVQVTAINGGTEAVLSRGYGNTAGTAHAASAVFVIVATPAQEDAELPTDISTVRSKISNFTQVFLRGVKVSYTAQAVRMAGVPNEFGYQTAHRLKEVMREYDSSILLSNANSSVGTGSDTQLRTMGGLQQFAVGGSIGVVQVLTTGATNVTSEQISPDVINTMASAIWYNGGMTAGPYNGFIVTSGKQKRRIAQFDASYRRLDYNSNRVGFTTEKFLSDLGYEFDIIVDPAMPDDLALMGDLNRVATLPLQGEAVRVEDIAKTGRALKAMITGEYTGEFRNAAQTTAHHGNLT